MSDLLGVVTRRRLVQKLAVPWVVILVACTAYLEGEPPKLLEDGERAPLAFSHAQQLCAAKFVDLSPGHWAEPAIYALFHDGITRGCSREPLRFCPDAQLTRRAAAVLILRAMHGGDFIPPAAKGLFDDVPAGDWSAPWVEQLFREGVTHGCLGDADRFCPDKLVTRTTMAVLLLRAQHGGNYKPPAAKGIFADLDRAHWAAPWAERLFNKGITSGCSKSPLSFCPDQPVTRAAAAVLLARSFSLPDVCFDATAKVPVHNNHLFDLGVVDFDGDGNLDVFTSTHNAQQNLLRGDGSGRFSDVLSKHKLDQDHGFPGIETLYVDPPAHKPGLYIFRSPGELLNIRTHQTAGLGPIKGRITLNSWVRVESQKGIAVDLQETKLQSGETKTRIDFSANNEASLSLYSHYVSLPHVIDLDPQIPLDKVFIGARGKHPTSHNFVLNWRDRHGWAWADFSGDGRTDLFIARGGLRGDMAKLAEGKTFHDELLLNQSSAFADITHDSGLSKNNCAGYQAAWVDINNDSLLDLYVSCVRDGRNQLYQQQPDGRFVNVAAQLGLDTADNSWYWPFAFADLDNDGDMDLLLERSNNLLLYRNNGGTFTGTVIAENLRYVTKLAIADFDADGDLDVFAVSPTRSALLINTGATLRVTDPGAVGLPRQGRTANWVDYDNDGKPDLHVLPGGLYRQVSPKAFVNEHHFGSRSGVDVEKARCTWFDADNDGSRDLLMAVRERGSSVELRNWGVLFHKNIVHRNHWLQISLSGPRGLAQAIGARVFVSTKDGTQVQQVGCSEGSNFSQGHFRLYYGLGANEAASVRIEWPDGKSQQMSLGADEIDKLLIVKR